MFKVKIVVLGPCKVIFFILYAVKYLYVGIVQEVVRDNFYI